MVPQVAHFVDDFALAVILGRDNRFGRFLADLFEDLVLAAVKQIFRVGLVPAMGPFIEDDAVQFVQDAVEAFRFGNGQVLAFPFVPQG